MLIHYMHSYCGGRLITGLYNPRNSDNEGKPPRVFELCARNWSEPADGRNNTADNWPYLPSTVEEFQQILKKFLYVEHGKEGFQGVVFAVTNNEQTVAPKYLEASGFKVGGKFKKHIASNNCITWIGDYRNDMYPILSKVPNYTGVKSESKFKSASVDPLSTLSRPMPIPIRDSAQQTLSTPSRR